MNGLLLAASIEQSQNCGERNERHEDAASDADRQHEAERVKPAMSGQQHAAEADHCCC